MGGGRGPSLFTVVPREEGLPRRWVFPATPSTPAVVTHAGRAESPLFLSGEDFSVNVAELHWLLEGKPHLNERSWVGPLSRLHVKQSLPLPLFCICLIFPLSILFIEHLLCK